MEVILKTNNKTIELLTASGRVPVPIKREISLHGVPGFAVHRPLAYDGVTPALNYWRVSHIDSGASCSSLRDTIDEAVTDALSTLERLYARRESSDRQESITDWLPKYLEAEIVRMKPHQIKAI